MNFLPIKVIISDSDRGKQISSPKNDLSIPSFISLGKNWNIAKKIGFGYALAIGIAVLGGAIGLVVGEWYQKNAEQQLQLAEQQQEYLNILDNTVLKILSHPQQLAMVLDNTIWFKYETSDFLEATDYLQQVLVELGQFVELYPDNIAVSHDEFLALDRGYANTIDGYKTKIQALWTRIDPLKLTPQEIPIARQEILKTLAGQEILDLRLQFENLNEDLLRIRSAARGQKEAAITERIYANQLRLGIVIGSLGFSVAIAALLAWRTSRAIARPLEAVTQVARKVTQNSNFNLRAPVLTQDEVGSLADSLNQLIEWTGEYTQELENARENLEQCVEDRTHELKQTLRNLKQTQAQLIQTEKMSSLGQMVAGVAHEINNPVSFIHGNLIHVEQSVGDLFELLDLYQEESSQPSPNVEELIEEIDLNFLRSDMPQMLKSMKMGSDRIKEIVLSLRNFSRLDEAEVKDADIHAGIDNTLTILNNRLKQGVEVIKNYGNIPPIFCYPAQLNQVFMNLIANALDALFEAEIEGKQITITTETIESDRVKINIRDNGTGIPNDVKKKLFDPFFTTKPVGKGTGLGLSICYQIIEKHKGTISVDSELDKGTEFTITLPIQGTD